ncbi:MAG: hypothetical protein WC457_04270 [Patescibacteria group bacterium]
MNFSQLSFGSTADTGCKSRPLEFITDYNCPSAAANIVGWDTSGYGIDWNYIAANYGHPTYVCAFKPKVQVLDNWGWCTGSCTNDDDVVKGNGCYSESDTGDQCKTSYTKPWVNYDGYIVVVPVL